MIVQLLSLFLTTQIPLPQLDPSLEWKSKYTKNFRIHYSSELEKVASRLSLIVEPIHNKLSSQMRWTPSGPVHVVLLNNTDTANGLSTPIPYNSIYLNISPPEAGSSLDYYDEWLTVLFSHEYTHSIHIDMVHGINKFLRLFMGRAIVPNAAQPQWLIEGFAAYNETIHSKGGRGRSSFVQTYIRSAALKGEFLPISRATYWNDIFPFGNAAYWYGVGFYNYIAEKYGGEKWVDFAHKNASSLVPGWFNFKTKDIFGKSFSRMWREWQEEEISFWKEKTASYQPKMKTENLYEKDLYLAGEACWASPSKLYAVVQNSERKVQLVSFEWTESHSKPQIKVLENSFPVTNLHCQDEALLYSKLGESSRYNSYSDLWLYDLKEKKSRKITHGLRLKDPVVHRDYIYAVQTSALESKIVRLPFPKELLSEDLHKKNKWKAIRDPNQLEPVYTPSDFSTISRPQISKDGTKILFSMFKENESRDLYIWNLKNQSLSRITSDVFLEYSPQWLSEDEILFTSDRFLGNTDVRVFNSFRLNLQTRDLEQLTDTWTGIYFPRANGNRLIFGHFEDEGFKLKHLHIKPISSERLIFDPLQPSIPPILEGMAENPEEVKTEEYKIGSSLLPRYLIPFGYYTEEDSLIGALVGGNDPLGFHRWMGLGYFVVEPKRPGATLTYSYLGLGKLSLNFLVAAGISNFGKILMREQGGALYFINKNFYERTYRASAGLSYQLWWNEAPRSIYLSHDISLIDRRPLLSVPEEVLREPIKLNDRRIQVFPDLGQQLSISSSLFLGGNFKREIDAIAPSSGRLIRLELEYSPKIPGMDFHTLTSSFTYKEFFGLFRYHSLGIFGTLGVQWLDRLYQSSFRLGGSLGETALNAFNRRNIPLRGLPSTALRGEGVVAQSLEYRFPILRRVPGWGTAPIWFRNFSGVLFSDLGQTFQIKDKVADSEDFNWKGFTWSLGAELRSDTSLYYGPPISFRLGYGHVLYLEGQRVKGKRIDEVYFQIGSSF